MPFIKGQEAWNKGVPRTPEEKQKMRNAALGKKASLETLKRMSDSHKHLRPSNWGAGFKQGNIPWNRKATIDAYFAGIVDGEGYITIRENGKIKGYEEKEYYILEVRISMTDTQALEEAHKEYGGSLYIYKSKREGQSDYWNLSIKGEKAKKFLSRIKPYLRIKNRQAEICMEFRKIQETAIHSVSIIDDKEQEYRKKLMTELKSLHMKKGVQQIPSE